MEELIEIVRKGIERDLRKSEFIKIDYNSRRTIPPQIIDRAWGFVDWDKVIEDISPMLHTRICNAIVGGLETELKTDVKKLMSVDGVREKLRMEVYPKLMKVLEGE